MGLNIAPRGTMASLRDSHPTWLGVYRAVTGQSDIDRSAVLVTMDLHSYGDFGTYSMNKDVGYGYRCPAFAHPSRPVFPTDNPNTSCVSVLGVLDDDVFLIG